MIFVPVFFSELEWSTDDDVLLAMVFKENENRRMNPVLKMTGIRMIIVTTSQVIFLSQMTVLFLKSQLKTFKLRW